MFWNVFVTISLLAGWCAFFWALGLREEKRHALRSALEVGELNESQASVIVQQESRICRLEEANDKIRRDFDKLREEHTELRLKFNEVLAVLKETRRDLAELREGQQDSQDRVAMLEKQREEELRGIEEIAASRPQLQRVK